MKYEHWKNEKDLQLICKDLLDNADMDYSFSDFPLSIEIVFYVMGSDIKVVFYCSEIRRMFVEKEHDDVPMHLVLEVNVKETGDGYLIQVLPEFNMELECKVFNWFVKEFSESERSEVYPNA